MMLRTFEAALAEAGYEVSRVPDFSGQEVLARLRWDVTTADAVVLMVSGDEEVQHRLEGFEGGENDYLTKPMDLRELLARIQVQLSSRVRWLGGLTR